VSSFDPSRWPGVGDLPATPPDVLAPPAGDVDDGSSGSSTPRFAPTGSTPPWLDPLPPGSEPPPPPDRRGWLLAAAVGAVALLVVAALVGYRIGQPDDVAAPTTTTPTTPRPSATPTSTVAPAPSSSAPPSSPPTTSAGPTTTDAADAELNATVEDIEKFVAQQRGLEFTQPVVAKELDDQAFVQQLLSTETDQDRQDEMKEGDQLEALGLVPPNTDFVDITNKALSSGVVGFYDPHTKALYVRGTDLGPYVRTTLAHELTHALDDQHFQLDRPQYDSDKGEISFGFSALTEGNARRIENAYRDQLSTADRRSYDKSQSLVGNGSDLSDVPPVVLQLESAPYDLGEPFVDALLQQGGQPELDQAFTNPPTTSEQVITPSKYFAGEGAAKVAPPPADGPVETDGAVGELVTDLLLRSAISQDAAARAVAGWGGDWSVLYQSGNQRCMRIDYVGDTPNDLQQLGQAFQQWASAGSGRVVQTPDPSTVRVTSCVPQ
jgi:hypothetical protein